jgi:MFS family permease
MWAAQFASNVGSWMQTVGAQWLMLSLTSSAVPVALIQTASSLPVLLFAVPAGAIGDLVDRRRFILGAQAFMLVAATALGVLTLAGLATPWLVLALLFAVGGGQAFTSPTWQTLQPELVPASERPQAIAARVGQSESCEGGWTGDWWRADRADERWLGVRDQRGDVPCGARGGLPLARGNAPGERNTD